MSASSSVLAETFFAENARAILPGSQNPSSLLKKCDEKRPKIASRNMYENEPSEF